MSSLIFKKQLVIAGPCSAENEAQVLLTAQQLKLTGKVDLLRAGVWKPRTSPGGFEGAGVKALAWLAKAKQETGLPFTVEVATSSHVEDALGFDTDVLWLGARTTVNPFSVQNVADALRGTNATVLIKNPVNADIKLWIGAVERLQKVGITNIGLIHRGFTSYGSTEYRNVPLWQIPIEMMRLFPTFPMICDPSHICGRRDTLMKVMQKSIDLAYTGLMVEAHNDPDVALTDKMQQVTPAQLNTMLEALVWKKDNNGAEDFKAQIEHLREQINYVDDELLTLIANRMRIAKEIGVLKQAHNVTIFQQNRWNEIRERMLCRAKELDLSEDFVNTYLEAIHIESIRIQNFSKSNNYEIKD